MENKMNILLLAPHPFYQERGSPIAVQKLLAVLSERGDRIDVVTYHEGTDFEYEHVTLHRIPNLPFIRHIRPGFSWKKVLCDGFMCFKVGQLLLKRRYELVHAVEESVFIALLLKLFLGIPYVYDMDSSLAQQMMDKYSFLRKISVVLNFFERLAVNHAKAIVPVCKALAVILEQYNPSRVIVLPDISLLQEVDAPFPNQLKAELGIDGLVLMYVGNLEGYQGIDLLLESFALLAPEKKAQLVIIGGTAEDIEKYRQQAIRLAIGHKTHFIGPKPVKYLSRYLAQADILLSPRITGQNTPMKVYSYLDSGKAILATDLPTHTQVLDHHVAMLAAPQPTLFAQGLCHLIENEQLRLRLGEAAQKLVQEKFAYAVFYEKVNTLFDWLSHELVPEGKSALTP
jgi:glycosyltransferase involved in cell wall biosynthesis